MGIKDYIEWCNHKKTFYFEYDPWYSEEADYDDSEICNYKIKILETLTRCLNELINDLPVEFNELKLLCEHFYDKSWKYNFSCLYLNQKIIKDRICEIYNIQEV